MWLWPSLSPRPPASLSPLCCADSTPRGPRGPGRLLRLEQEVTATAQSGALQSPAATLCRAGLLPGPSSAPAGKPGVASAGGQSLHLWPRASPDCLLHNPVTSAWPWTAPSPAPSPCSSLCCCSGGSNKPLLPSIKALLESMATAPPSRRPGEGQGHGKTSTQRQTHLAWAPVEASQLCSGCPSTSVSPAACPGRCSGHLYMGTQRAAGGHGSPSCHTRPRHVSGTITAHTSALLRVSVTEAAALADRPLHLSSQSRLQGHTAQEQTLGWSGAEAQGRGREGPWRGWRRGSVG